MCFAIGNPAPAQQFLCRHQEPRRELGNMLGSTAARRAADNAVKMCLQTRAQLAARVEVGAAVEGRAPAEGGAHDAPVVAEAPVTPVHGAPRTPEQNEVPVTVKTEAPVGEIETADNAQTCYTPTEPALDDDN